MKPYWITVSQSQGDGDAAVTITAAPNTGRNQRIGNVTVSTGSITKTVNVVQMACSEFLTSDQSTAVVQPDGDMLILEGVSNSKGLTFAWEDGMTISPAIYEYYIHDKAVDNGSHIPGDPGQDGAYKWHMEVEVPPYEPEYKIVGLLHVVSDDGEKVSIVIYAG